MSWWKDWKPKILCLGSGGMKGLDELGTLWWFWSEGVLVETDSFIGCSVGGIIAVLLVIGYWPHQILSWALDTALFKDMSEIQVHGVAQDYGLVTNKKFDDALANRLRTMIIEKMGRIPTLKDLYKITGKKLFLVAVSLKQEEEIYLSHETTPDMDLMVALRATSSTPPVFGKLEYQKDYLSDGALMVPLPCLHLDDGKTPMLAIGVSDVREWVFEKIDIMKYFDRLTSLPLKKLTQFAVANVSSACYVVLVPVSDSLGLVESSSRESRLSKFLSGYRFAENYVPNHPHPRKSHVEVSPPPISMEAIMACFHSSAGKMLMKCYSEDPQLFSTCAKKAGLNLPQPVEVEEKKEVIVSPQAVKQEEKDEEILELTPISNHFDSNEIRFSSIPDPRRYDYFPHPSRTRGPQDGILINVTVHMTPGLVKAISKTLNAVGGLFLGFLGQGQEKFMLP